MENFLFILICLAAGWGLKQAKLLPVSTPAVLNGFAIYLSLPALVFRQIHDLRVIRGTEVVLPLLMPPLIFAGSFLLFSFIGGRRHWSRATVGAVILLAGLGNTSFLGFPLLEAIVGRESLKIAIFADQSCFLVLATLGVVLATSYAGKKASVPQIIRRVVAFPATLALVAGLTLRGAIIPMPVALCLERLATTLVPLVLVSVGFQLDWSGKSHRGDNFAVGTALAYKLVIAPLFILILSRFVFHSSSLAEFVSVLEAGMAPMITAAMFCLEYNLRPDLAARLVGLGIPLSLLTVPLWAWVLRSI